MPTQSETASMAEISSGPGNPPAPPVLPLTGEIPPPSQSDAPKYDPTVKAGSAEERCKYTLNQFVDSKPGLREFFPDKIFAGYAARAARLVDEIIKLKCPKETAQQFAILVLYDLALLIDDSSSMYTDDDGARVKTLHTLLKAVAEVYELAREEGIMSVRYLNGRQGRKNVTKAKVDEVHKAIRYHGLTMIGTQLQEKILKPFVEKKVMTKPLLTMIITDGAIEGESSGVLEKNIYNCLTSLQSGPKPKTEDAVAFMFARIGDDPGAKELIESLDNHKDMDQWIDCLPVNEKIEDVGNGSAEHWSVLRKLFLGALDADIDRFDVVQAETPIDTSEKVLKLKDHHKVRPLGEEEEDV
ncbi:hypothetical protein BZA05DRAFT_210917 [Tricharina praecox]|uniref:uncharacterized protein n=1 Tax=Tricharina praecox TaxID=43433 RepID=UPI00222126E2|nr:uncharacterized protein BZA05DRAFT_210917 [Tricharina praecox]KAI5841682.1 hypothetical protein BZA05DRAFT_210917 [Tricharina praecox]